LLLSTIIVSAQQQTVTHSISPATFEETTSILYTINGSSVNEAAWGVTGNALYMWAWSMTSMTQILTVLLMGFGHRLMNRIVLHTTQDQIRTPRQLLQIVSIIGAI
jgi:hypothetical protein